MFTNFELNQNELNFYVLDFSKRRRKNKQKLFICICLINKWKNMDKMVIECSKKEEIQSLDFEL